jgi:AraC-like DNA-binding protein
MRCFEEWQMPFSTGKHAAKRFRQETGENLKVFLDRTRADIAAKLLRTSSKSLEELAAQLEFRDVYAFSRFFKRTMNDTLSGYRKKVFLTFEWPAAKARSNK